MTDETSNTGSNQSKKGQFTKGDPRINRKGRPKSFDKWRDLVQEIMAEPAMGNGGLVLIQIPLTKDGKPVLDDEGRPVMVDHYATNAEMVVRSWLKDSKRQQQLAEAAFGKVPQAIDVTSGGKPLNWKDFISGNSEDDSE